MSKQILVVDNSDTCRKVTRLFLESQLGLEVCGEAVDGVDAIEKARALKPDLVVLDLAMPRMNGVEAASELRAMMPRSQLFYSRCTMTPWAGPWRYPQVRTLWFPSLAAGGN
jgi:two-component system chemotaxis response regulator CheB